MPPQISGVFYNIFTKEKRLNITFVPTIPCNEESIALQGVHGRNEMVTLIL